MRHTLNYVRDFPSRNFKFYIGCYVTDGHFTDNSDLRVAHVRYIEILT